MPAKLLDTDTLSEIIRGRNTLAVRRASDYLEEHGGLTFSLITRYEVLRGLKWKRAAVQITAFERRCFRSHVLPLTDEIIVRAADLYAHARSRGRPASDADLLIAATALVWEIPLVTTNTAHFEHLPGLELECWTRPHE